MRKIFFQELYQKMARNKDIWSISGDLGYGGFDPIKKDFPDRFINTGAAEQSMIGIAVGLALENKIPFVYSITPFLLFRPFEVLRNYINHEKIPVKLVGSGRDGDYINNGFSHWAGDDRIVKKIFPNIVSLRPKSKEEIPGLLNIMIRTKKAFYLNLKRS